MKRNLLKTVGLVPLTGLVSLGMGSAEKHPAKPNIVIILGDDMGYGDLTCYNPGSKIPTPNMDQLATQGIRFTDAHSPAALSTPSRYGLLTGSYCWRTRLKSGVILGYDEAPLIEQGQPTLAGMLRDRGYGTACIGKWHLGMTWPTLNGYKLQDDKNEYRDSASILFENERHIDFASPIPEGPLDVGFDYFFGSLGCTTSDPPYVFIENRRTVTIPTRMSPESFKTLPGFAPGLMADDWSEENVDLTFTEKAIRFMENHRKTNPERPFLLYLALNSPHNPFLPPDLTKGTTAEGPRGDLVAVADWSVGKIVEYLKANGLFDNTLLIVTSDNGAMRGANGHRSMGDFRGYKASIWEGGHRVPFIASWPGVIKPGALCDETLSLTDLLPTLDRMTGGKKERVLHGPDGYDMWPSFIGKEKELQEGKPRVFHSGAGLFALRQGDWKMIENPGGRGELYNLAEDPGETKNLWDQQPERVKEMEKTLALIRNRK